MSITMSVEEILGRVQTIKSEAAEKDEVITEQQRQIHELEAKVSDIESRYRELEERNDSLNSSVTRTDEMLEQLTVALA